MGWSSSFFFPPNLVCCSLEWNITDWVTQEMRLANQVVFLYLKTYESMQCSFTMVGSCRGTRTSVVCLQCLFSSCAAEWGGAFNYVVTKESKNLISNQKLTFLPVEKHLTTTCLSLPFTWSQTPFSLTASRLPLTPLQAVRKVSGSTGSRESKCQDRKGSVE